MFDAKKVKDEIINWIADFFKKSGTMETKAVIGISGGKDSSIVAALCKEALGRDRVIGVLMPDGEQDDINYSYEICQTLDIKYFNINIRTVIQALSLEIEKSNLKLNNAASFNIPARIRMSTLYAVSAITGGRVANTCNLSENWVGYSTKFGDGAGDFSPLANLTVSEVKAIGMELNLPLKFVNKIPVDGLSGKTDEENLGFSYEILDRYIREGICEDIGVKEKIDNLHKNNIHKINPMPAYPDNPSDN